ncbi:hypothetical protein BKA56DRAFT_327762 [Ilyonectria sp. MPI-CAGE-AT-0026]|nr:hypothetical protein BKA56DRAFT_327762 [Ilyonectria sp. MPI-CAGE-AT-0026]
MPYSSTPCRLVTRPRSSWFPRCPCHAPMSAAVPCPMLTRPACSGTGRFAVFGQQAIHATVDHPWRVRAVVAGIITFKLDARATMDELVACQTLGADIVKTGRPISSHQCRMGVCLCVLWVLKHAAHLLLRRGAPCDNLWRETRSCAVGVGRRFASTHVRRINRQKQDGMPHLGYLLSEQFEPEPCCGSAELKRMLCRLIDSSSPGWTAGTEKFRGAH